jgi:DNA polymerase III delta subunit
MLKEAGSIAGESPLRIEVPGKGSGEPDGEGVMRQAVEPVIPALQSGSLFGENPPVLLVDAQNLSAAEATVLAEVIPGSESTLILVVTGSLPAPMAAAVKSHGRTQRVGRLREKDAMGWVATEAKSKNVKLDAEARGALIARFGTDLASIGAAIDQLRESDEPITGAEIRDRFKNRPDEPVWLFADAVSAGDVPEALRRLTDFLTHTHPLVLLAYLEGDLRRRALAAAAPDLNTLTTWLGVKPDNYPAKKAWNQRTHTSDSELRRALGALARADRVLKTEPEETHVVTLERLTVALCRWFGGQAVRR